MYEVQHICRKALQPRKTLTFEQKVRRLDKQHVDFLLNPRTLEQWAGLTMKQRSVLFHRQFTNKRVAVTSLRRLYLSHGIRRKKVRMEKVMPRVQREDFVNNCQLLLAKLEQARSEGRQLIYLDEINFTKRSLQLRDWSGKNSNLTVDQKEVYVGYRSVIASMTEEGGIL